MAGGGWGGGWEDVEVEENDGGGRGGGTARDDTEETRELGRDLVTEGGLGGTGLGSGDSSMRGCGEGALGAEGFFGRPFLLGTRGGGVAEASFFARTAVLMRKRVDARVEWGFV